jgi:FkbM family methyltransferase
MIRYPRSVSATEPRLVSYAQNGEDVMIDRVFHKKAGFFIDVGAFHPIIDSVTKHFSLLGWNGINIEPDGDYFAALALDRPSEVNLRCAVGRAGGETVLHQVELRQCSTTSDQQFNRFSDAVRRASQSVVVPVRTLADICREHVRGEIDFLKIDVEGSEAEVILGADWERDRPRLLLIEAAADAPDWESGLLRHGYLFQHFDGINRYYLRVEDRPLAGQLSAPVNYLDWYFSFGDMIYLKERGAL